MTQIAEIPKKSDFAPFYSMFATILSAQKDSRNLVIFSLPPIFQIWSTLTSAEAVALNF